MQDPAVRKCFGVPVQMDRCEMFANGLVIDPKYAIVFFAGYGRVVIESSHQFWCPAFRVKMTVRPTPSLVAPRILDLHKPFTKNTLDV